MSVCTCMCATTCSCVWVCWLSGVSGRGPLKRGERGEQQAWQPIWEPRHWGSAWPQLAPPPTILAFLFLSGTQRVNSNSLLMNWLLKVARRADPAHLLKYTHWQQYTRTQTQWRKCFALKYISLHSRVTVQLDLDTCGGSVSSSWL